MIRNESINSAINYILNNINEDLSVDEVASYCNFSKYYFSRLFKAETGESIYEFIKRIKLEQSAFRLKVEKNKTITEIGWKYGYSSSNYSTTFKQYHTLSPIEFRRSIETKSLSNPIFPIHPVHLESFESCNKKISIDTLEDFSVIYERYKGNYQNLSTCWGNFQEKYHQYITNETLLIERTYDDPSITHVDECLYDLCIPASKDCSLKNTYNIKGGRFAIYHFKGTVDQIYAAYQSIFNVWLAKSDFVIDNRYGFEVYRRINCDTMYMEIDFYIPIQ